MTIADSKFYRVEAYYAPADAERILAVYDRMLTTLDFCRE